MGSNPFSWFFPIASVSPLFIHYISTPGYHPSLASLIGSQNLFFVVIIAVFSLAPGISLQTRIQKSGTETDFILTRAVNRSMVYRARATHFYLLVLVVPMTLLLLSLRDPMLFVSENSASNQQKILREDPGNILILNDKNYPNQLISMSQGKVLLESWHCWQCLMFSVIIQLLLFSIGPLKIWNVIYYTLATLMLIYMPFYMIFMVYLTHQWLFWICAILTLILVELACEQRFSTMDHGS